MQNSHKGLPKNIPQSKVKPKIFASTGSNKGTPLKTQQSPGQSAYKSSPCRTPEKETSLCKSQHRLKSKQKPIKQTPIIKPKQKVFDTTHVNKFDDGINPSTFKSNHLVQKPKDTQFVQTILSMMGPLAKNENIGVKAQQSLMTKKGQNLNKSNIIESKSSANNQKNNQTPVQSLRYLLDSQIQPLPEVVDQQMVNKCATMLKDRKNWSSYNGELINKKKTGYGILYFKNQDKFMGGFKDDKAYGHGTYYDHESKRRIIAVWQDNQVSFSKQIIVQKI